MLDVGKTVLSAVQSAQVKSGIIASLISTMDRTIIGDNWASCHLFMKVSKSELWIVNYQNLHFLWVIVPKYWPILPLHELSSIFVQCLALNCLAKAVSTSHLDNALKYFYFRHKYYKYNHTLLRIVVHSLFKKLYRLLFVRFDENINKFF